MKVKNTNIKIIEIENNDFELVESHMSLENFFIRDKKDKLKDAAYFRKKDLNSLIKILQRYEKELGLDNYVTKE